VVSTAVRHGHRAFAPVDNTLAFMDQASFVWVRASGHVHGIQCTWVYRRDIDISGLRRMHDNLAHGLLGRRIERSPLPFGRHRWVSCHELPGIDVTPPARTHAALAGWLEERAHKPVDPELGPAWHLGVLPIEGYGTAVTLVASHTVIDGVGLCLAVADAAKGVRHDFGYPPPHSRPRRRAMVEDGRQTVRGLPQIARALGAMATLAVHNRPSRAGRSARPSGSKSTRELDRPVAVPTSTVHIDQADWDARAESLGGTSNALLAGFAAKLAEKFGRLRPRDDLVTLTYPVNDRTENDLRANALKGIDFAVDPGPVTGDLRKIRNDFKQTIIAGLGKFAEQERVFPLTPFVPTAVVRKLPLAALNSADLPVGCSNLGEIDSATAHADGTKADYVAIRLVEQNLTANSPELASGELCMVSGRICGKVFITLRAYHPGPENSKRNLRELISDTLADFDLTGVIE
jgi:diacylglycerol O-acyltransferase / wax synthase